MAMRLQIGERWAERLCKLRESGMGYQRVDVRLNDGNKVEGVLVFNAEELEWPAAYSPITSNDIAEIQLGHRGE